MTVFTAKCLTADCETLRVHADSKDEAHTCILSNGWVDTGNGWLCPACASTDDTDEPERPVLSIPLSCGVFGASAPHGMTAGDWRLVADVCLLIATGQGDSDD